MGETVSSTLLEFRRRLSVSVSFLSLFRDNAYSISEAADIEEGTRIEIKLKTGDCEEYANAERIKEVHMGLDVASVQSPVTALLSFRYTWFESPVPFVFYSVYFR